MEYENESPAPLTIKKQPKVFGAPPTNTKGSGKKPKTTKSGIPTKKNLKASKSPTLVVCSASNQKTPFEKKPLVLSKQGIIKKNADEIQKDEDNEEVGVISGAAPNTRRNKPENVKKFNPRASKKENEKEEPMIAEDDEDIDVISDTVPNARRNKPEKVKKFSPRASKNQEDLIIDDEVEEDEEPVAASSFKQKDDEDDVRRHKKGVRILQEPEENELEEVQEEPKEEIVNEDAQEEVKENSGEKKKRRKRRHHTHQKEAEDQENPENEPEEGSKAVPETPRADGKTQGPDEEEQSGVTSLLDGVLEEMKGSANAAMQKIAEWQSDLINQLVPLEDQQIQYWYLHTRAYLEQQNINFDQNKLEFYENLTELVDVLMIKHRIPSVNKALHRMRILISGPRSSGKSTLLAIAAERAIIELAASGEWKKTFIFAYDFDSNAHKVKALDMLYKSIVTTTFKGLSAQRPLVTEYADALSRCFCDIIEGTPLLPKGFCISNDFRSLVPQLQQLISLIKELWTDESNREAFIANTLLFPIQIAKIFGFERQLVIADHFDSFALGTTPEEIFVMESVKALLDMSSFIAAAQVQERAAEIIKPGIADGIDLTQSIFRLSTLDVVEDDQYADREFVFHLSEGTKHFNINSSFFGGCPAFLKLWYEMNELADEIENEENAEEEEQDDEKIEQLEEMRILLINKAGEILNALTDCSEEFVVTGVNKAHKK